MCVWGVFSNSLLQTLGDMTSAITMMHMHILAWIGSQLSTSLILASFSTEIGSWIHSFKKKKTYNVKNLQL